MTEERWRTVRAEFELDPTRSHFAAMMLSTHPRAVREAIRRHQQQFDAQPWAYLKGNLHAAENAVCEAASEYFDVERENIALIDGTTIGLALLFAGLQIRSDQEILTTPHEFHGALVSIEARERSGCRVRKVPLFRDTRRLSTDDILARLKQEFRPETRVVALSWVYSNSGVKLPIAEVSKWLRSENAKPERTDPKDKVLFCVDGVVGLGVETSTFQDLGCDFFVGGCHKFLFGPRGTGIWCGTPFAWSQYAPVAPTSSKRVGPGLKHSPGGIHTYEHRWALTEAFRFCQEIGKPEIQKRVAQLAARFQDGLSAMGDRVAIVTPASADFASALISFDLANQLSTSTIVRELEDAGIFATASPSDVVVDPKTGEVALDPKTREELFTNHARVGVAMFTLEAEVDHCLRAIDRLSRLPRQ